MQQDDDGQWKESMPYYWRYRYNNTEKKEKTSKEHVDVVVAAADGSDTRGASAANFAVRRHSSWKMLLAALPLMTTTTAMATQRIFATAKLQDIDSFNFYHSLA